MDKEKPFDLDKEVRNIGIALIVLGIIHFVLSQFLDFTWGFVLIAVGTIALFYRSRKMLLTFGILLIVVGILNISSYAIALEEGSGFWGIFGIIQIVWGIQEINRFRKTKENPKYDIKEKIKKGFVWYGLRTGFWIMIGCWAISIFLSGEENLYFAFWTFWIISTIFTFVISIIHLTKYKHKALAIISLVFSSFLLLTAIVGFLFGIYMGDSMYMDDSMAELEVKRALGENEYSDGRIFFIKPTALEIQKDYYGVAPIYILSKDEEMSITILSDIAYVDQEEYFDSFYDEAYMGLSEGYELDYSIIEDTQDRTSNGFDYIKKSIRIEGEDTFVWSVVVIYDTESQKIAGIGYFSPQNKNTQYKTYLQEVINSVKFS
jgi:hypothetical protein